MKKPNVSIDLGTLDFNFLDSIAEGHTSALYRFDDYYEDLLKDAIYELLIDNLPRLMREAALQVEENQQAMDEMESMFKVSL